MSLGPLALSSHCKSISLLDLGTTLIPSDLMSRPSIPSVYFQIRPHSEWGNTIHPTIGFYPETHAGVLGMAGCCECSLFSKVQIVITRTQEFFRTFSQLSIQLKLFTNESFTFFKTQAFDLYWRFSGGNIQETIRQDVQASQVRPPFVILFEGLKVWVQPSLPG